MSADYNNKKYWYKLQQKYRQYFLQKYRYHWYIQQKVSISILAITFASIINKPGYDNVNLIRPKKTWTVVVGKRLLDPTVITRKILHSPSILLVYGES